MTLLCLNLDHVLKHLDVTSLSFFPFAYLLTLLLPLSCPQISTVYIMRSQLSALAGGLSFKKAKSYYLLQNSKIVASKFRAQSKVPDQDVGDLDCLSTIPDSWTKIPDRPPGPIFFQIVLDSLLDGLGFGMYSLGFEDLSKR